MGCKESFSINTQRFIKQGIVDGNEMQKHLCGFTVGDLEQLSFKCYGTAGLKALRADIESMTMSSADLTNNIRYRSKLLFFVIATLSQLFVLHFPKYAFSLFTVYRKK
jgi:hypothetical protein